MERERFIARSVAVDTAIGIRFAKNSYERTIPLWSINVTFVKRQEYFERTTKLGDAHASRLYIYIYAVTGTPEY